LKEKCKFDKELDLCIIEWLFSVFHLLAPQKIFFWGVRVKLPEDMLEELVEKPRKKQQQIGRKPKNQKRKRKRKIGSKLN
jgi:hypothetical protein